jgi:hypothetical protein
MKNLAVISLLLGAASAVTYKSTLSRLGETGNTLASTSANTVRGSPFQLELQLDEGTDYIKFTMATYDVICQWSYMHSGLTEPKKITKELGACDYPTRSITNTLMTLTMPVIEIPHFDKNDTLIFDCYYPEGNPTLKLQKFECPKVEKEEAPSDTSSKFDFRGIWPEPVIGPATPANTKPRKQKNYDIITFASLAGANLALTGSQPCINAALDVADISFYIMALDPSFATMEPYIYLMITQVVA